MDRSILEAVGITAAFDIPAADIFSTSLDTAAFGISDRDAERLRSLAAFVDAYNRERPCGEGIVIKDSRTAVGIVYDILRRLDHEETWIAYCDNRFRLVRREMICVGGLDSVTMDSKRIAKHAVLYGARGIVVFHNHPSGDPAPSNADIRETERIKKMLETLDVSLIDHIIVSDGCFFSFSTESKLSMPCRQ